MNGAEYDDMMAEIAPSRTNSRSWLSALLLTGYEDYEAVIAALRRITRTPVRPTPPWFTGHGTFCQRYLQ